MNPRTLKRVISAVLILAIVVIGYFWMQQDQGQQYSESVQFVPEFLNTPHIILNNNQPEFTESDYTTTSYEKYSELDSLNRCGAAIACIGLDIMPTEERGSIGQIKPTGWHTVKYDIVDGKYLYNRCHLIGYQLTGENANEKNLITGTRYLNVEGMLPFENMVADYIKETGNHVAYRITPIYMGILSQLLLSIQSHRQIKISTGLYNMYLIKLSVFLLHI